MTINCHLCIHRVRATLYLTPHGPTTDLPLSLSLSFCSHQHFICHRAPLYQESLLFVFSFFSPPFSSLPSFLVTLKELCSVEGRAGIDRETEGARKTSSLSSTVGERRRVPRERRIADGKRRKRKKRKLPPSRRSQTKVFSFASLSCLNCYLIVACIVRT